MVAKISKSMLVVKLKNTILVVLEVAVLIVLLVFRRVLVWTVRLL